MGAKLEPYSDLPASQWPPVTRHAGYVNLLMSGPIFVAVLFFTLYSMFVAGSSLYIFGLPLLWLGSLSKNNFKRKTATIKFIIGQLLVII